MDYEQKKLDLLKWYHKEIAKLIYDATISPKELKLREQEILVKYARESIKL